MEETINDVIQTTIESYKMLKTIKDLPAIDKLKAYIQNDKFRAFCDVYPVIVNVLIYHGIFCKRALKAYILEYHREIIDSKDRYLEVSKCYLTHFKIEVLRKRNVNRDKFIMFYMKVMEDVFDAGEKEKEQRAEKLKEQKLIDLRRASQNRDTLNKLLGRY